MLIRADGAARGNPGPAAAGAVIIDATRDDARDPDAEPVAVIARPLGVQTNNFAEYTAVILALEKALALGAREAELVLDSQLVVEQLAGRWKVRHPGIKPLVLQANALLGRLEKWTVRHERRESNRAADALANLALDDPAGAVALEHRPTSVGGAPEFAAVASADDREEVGRETSDGPEAVVRAWFDAWAAGDIDSARRLMADDAIFNVSDGPPTRGFDAFRAWFEARRTRSSQAFGYRVIAITGGLSLASAIVAMRDVRDGREVEWEQVAVYRVDAGLIAEAWAIESGEPLDQVERAHET